MPVASVTFQDLPELDVTGERFRDEPWAVARELDVPDGSTHGERSRSGIARSARGLEVFGYDAARRFFIDPQLETGIDLIYAASGVTDGPIYDDAVGQLSNLEGRQHASIRAVLARYFSPQWVESMRAFVQETLDELLTAAEERGRVEFNAEVAARLPSRLTARIMGAPLADAPQLQRWSEEVMLVFRQDPSGGETIMRAYGEQLDYVKELIAHRERQPGDDFVSHLVAAANAGEIPREHVLFDCMAIMRAATDTTQSQLTLCVAALVDNPAGWELIRSRPDALSAVATEAVRLYTGVWTHMRVARRAIEVFGVELEAGTKLWASAMVAHRDPTVFARPDDFDPLREDARRPLNWGVGRHFCLGQPIAMLELEETLRAIAGRWRDVEHDGGLETTGRPAQNHATALPLTLRRA